MIFVLPEALFCAGQLLPGVFFARLLEVLTFTFRCLRRGGELQT